MAIETVAWIGNHDPRADGLEQIAGLEVIRIPDAGTALAELEDTPYPLIVVCRRVAAGNAPLPEGVSPMEGKDVALYLIKAIRESAANSGTPILFPLREGEYADKEGYADYVIAGAKAIHFKYDADFAIGVREFIRLRLNQSAL